MSAAGGRPGRGAQGSCNLHLVSHPGSHQVIVNSGPVSQSSACPRGQGGMSQSHSNSLAGRVTAVPLNTSRSIAPQQKVSKILIRVCAKGTKKDGKTFTLRSIQCDVCREVEECDQSTITG